MARGWTALYYPNVDPPMTWVRSAALFFNTVRSFMPEGTEDSLSAALKMFRDETGAWEPYRPTTDTAALVDIPTDKLNAAFRAISAQRRSIAKQRGLGDNFLLELLITADTIHFEGHVFLHGSKLSPRVRQLLEENDLILSRQISSQYMPGDWWLTNEQASDLILSHIANRIAAMKGWTSLTDMEECYAFEDLTPVSPTDANVAQDELARLVITDLVPAVVSDMSIKEYAALRRRYEPIRARLEPFFREIVTENCLTRIGDRKELRAAAELLSRDLKAEIDCFKKSKVGASVASWARFTLGSLCQIAGVKTSPDLGLLFAGAGVLIQALDKVNSPNPRLTKRNDMIRLIASARQDVLSSVSYKYYTPGKGLDL